LPAALTISLASIAISIGQDRPHAEQEQRLLPITRSPSAHISAATPTSTPDICLPPLCHAADCLFRGEAFAFVDENGNGKREAQEPPLAGVSFHLDDPLNQYAKAKREGMSNENGKGEVLVLQLMDCGVILGVYAVPPTGYTHTTPRLLPGNVPLEFGFKPVPALPGLPATGRP
jgi:hypothetical protein